jgi:demethylmenaquinone methyltransferase/2-methoxy-6-polyprenyl-1,4-benzoquinol methylase
MSAAERGFVLREARRRLRPGGVLAAGDEVLPRGAGKRALYRLLRLPQAAAGWLVVGSTSHPLPDLAAEVREAGLRVRSERRFLLESLAVVIGEREA